MTDIDLGAFEGNPVLTASVKVTNAGDGLSQALGVDPQILHHGDRGAIIIEYEVADVQFPPVKDTNGVARKHVLKAQRATLIDLDEVRDRLDAQQKRIEEAEGTLRLDLDGDDDSGGARTGGGEPQTAGEVLEDALGLADDADDTATWRAEREEELTGWKKAELSDHLEGLGCEFDDSMLKGELVAEILEWEEAERG